MHTTPLRAAVVAAVAGVGLTSFVTFAQPASAASKFQIVKVRFDSAGKDTPITNAKLNDEYVIITNTDTVEHNLSGWRIRDVANHVYVFPDGARLGAKKSVRVRTGRGTDTAANRYQNRGAYVWNNDADTAWLRNPQGRGGDVCSWKKSDPGSTKVC
jgi:hypothetical protein